MSNTIVKDNQVFWLHTKDTSYSFHILPSGQLEHLYYGARLDAQGHHEAILPKCEYVEGNLNCYDELHPTVGLENRCQEYSGRGKGDVREPMIALVYHNGSTTSDFVYRAHRIEQKQPLADLPSAYDEEDRAESLTITLEDVNYGVTLELCYSVFYQTNVITRSSKLINHSEHDLQIERLLSGQLDCDHGEYEFTTFKGAWAREMNRQTLPCAQGIVVNDSKAGVSSNRQNPFVMLSAKGTTEDFGGCYGCNLIYSGNHYEAVEVNGFGQTRLLCGINPFGFRYLLATGESFQAPEMVLTYSDRGFSGVSDNMHQFIRAHIVRGAWKNKERPVLLNSWEASYFAINEAKALRMARAASKVGVELFVLDDGWFGKRDDDRSSLGDWTVNRKKFPSGLAGLAKKINRMGMDFGIWVEPEMVSMDSDCYRAHPEYAVEIPGQAQSLGRHQLLLDLTQTKVQDYLIAQMTAVFSSANIRYVKWDMNRIVSDVYSQSLEPARQGEFFHRYYLGLYRVFEELCDAFPDVLFESCSSGGNRLDLGMLCYMPQVWASDNTDAICRAEIQTGCSYGYPMSVLGAHVSSCPNHQTLRVTSLDTRFQVACFGLLGYECNLVDLSSAQLAEIKAQIAWYKQYRKVLQFGRYQRLKNGEHGVYQWMTIAPEQDCAIGLYLQTQVTANFSQAVFQTKGLLADRLYRFTNRPLDVDVREFGDLINTIAPMHIKQNGLLHQIAAQFVKMHSEKEDYLVTGGALNQVGVRLKQGFAGVGYNDEMRFFQDYSSRLYLIEQSPETP